MRGLLLLPALLLAALPTRAQSVLDVHACAEDSDDGAPVEGAWVSARESDGPTAEGTTGADGCVWLTVAVSSGEEGASGAPDLAAGPAYPNPATSTAHVALALGREQTVAWRLYDLSGRLVREALPTPLPVGRHTLTIPLSGLPAGRYVYQITGTSGAFSGTIVKAGGGSTRTTAGSRADFTAAARLLFEVRRAGYDTLVTEQEVEPGATATLPLVKARGPGRPLMDMQPGQRYLGFEGGLYPGGANAAPDAHHRAGVERGRAVEPRDSTGAPDPNGRYVLLSIGFSNTTQEFCGEGAVVGEPCKPWSFVGQALADPAVARTGLTLVDGARGGLGVHVWANAGSAEYDRIRDEALAAQGLSEAQVQVVWVKVANPLPEVSLPHSNAEAYRLVGQYGDILRTLEGRYPNLQQVFFSSRNWGGYARTDLHPEPFAYETGFSVKWTIQAQIMQMAGNGLDPRAGNLNYTTVAPWAAWGPYLWAEGLRPRSDGLFWTPEDFEDDGTHPAQAAEQKVGALLLDFFKTSPYTRCWFVAGTTCG